MLFPASRHGESLHAPGTIPVHRVIELCRPVTVPGPGWTAASMGYPDIGSVSIPGREGLDGSMVLLLTPMLFLPGRVRIGSWNLRPYSWSAGFSGGPVEILNGKIVTCLSPARRLLDRDQTSTRTWDSSRP